jgi:hypothetical protein
VVYNDHGLNFFLDKVPTFALGCADTYYNDDEGWALKPVAPFKGNVQFSWHLAEKFVDQEFDICTCQEMKVDHGFVNPIRALWGTHDSWPITTIPLAVNTVQHPVPSALRCFKLGRALRKAIESYEEDLKVVVLGAGGIDAAAAALYTSGVFQGENVLLSLCCVGALNNREVARQFPVVPQILWPHITAFIYQRFRAYFHQKLSHPQWDQTGRLLWQLFVDCRSADEFGSAVQRCLKAG